VIGFAVEGEEGLSSDLDALSFSCNFFQLLERFLSSMGAIICCQLWGIGMAVWEIGSGGVLLSAGR